MKSLQFFGYNKCGTCRKAKQDLDNKGIPFEDIDITATPPTKSVLAAALKTGAYSIKDLFNKSGEMYRSLNMKAKLNSLNQDELLSLLAKHGKLIKRPLVTDGARFTVGYREEEFKKIWR